jgi:putative inorganic carbon (HCO3(-)) transporter
MQDFPITGMGLGMFRYVMPVLYPLFTVSPESDLGHAHNEWLQAGVDLGVTGLVIFLAVQGLGLWLAYRGFQSAASVPLRWMMAGTLAGLAAHSVFGLTDAVALGAKPGIFFWVLLALTAGMARLEWPATADRIAIETDARLSQGKAIRGYNAPTSMKSV